MRASEPLCAIDACDDPDSLRAVVAAGKAALQDGNDPMATVRTALAEVLRMPRTRVLSDDPAAPTVMTWDFATLREELRRNPPDWLRDETVKSYYRAMSPRQVGALERKYLIEITPEDIRQVRSQIEARGHIRQATLTIQAIKSAFEWATEDAQRKKSGITPDTNPAVEVSTKRRHKKKRTKADAVAAAANVKLDSEGELIFDDGTVPSREDLGKLLVLLLDPHKLPLMKRAVLLLLLYSVQRRYTVACAFPQVVATLKTAGYSVWIMDAGTTKAGLPHILPFALTAGNVLDQWKATLPANTEWLFPGLPTHAKPGPTGHLNVRTINDWLAAAWKQAGASRAYSPHAFRKAFDTNLSRLGVSRADRKLILHHHEGRNGDVTEEHYNLDPKLDEKLEVITTWNEFLRGCINKTQDTDRIYTGSVEEFVTGATLPKAALIGASMPALKQPDLLKPPSESQDNNSLSDNANQQREKRLKSSRASAGNDEIKKLQERLQKRAALDATLKEFGKTN